MRATSDALSTLTQYPHSGMHTCISVGARRGRPPDQSRLQAVWNLIRQPKRSI